MIESMDEFVERKGLARIAFDAYKSQVGGKTHDGKPIPEFNELSSSVRAGWIACVKAVAESILEHEGQ